MITDEELTMLLFILLIGIISDLSFFTADQRYIYLLLTDSDSQVLRTLLEHGVAQICVLFGHQRGVIVNLLSSFF